MWGAGRRYFQVSRSRALLRACYRCYVAAALVASSLVPLSAAAWNASGHRLSALIAWQQLDEATRGRVTQLLALHPDYTRWLAATQGGTDRRSVFVEASTWPDDIKHDRRFHDGGEGEPTHHLAGFPDMLRHRDWHYVNYSLASKAWATAAHGELDKRLDALISVLADENAPHAERAYALPWLVHLIADAHQPLHVVSRYDATGEGDEGGNRTLIRRPFRGRLSSVSLHAYWDDLPVSAGLRGERLLRAAATIVNAHPQPDAQDGTQHWLHESWRIARESAYPADASLVPSLTPEFHERASAIAQRRVAESGYRLAVVLTRVLGSRAE